MGGLLVLCVRGVFVRFGIVVCTAASLEFVGGAQYVIWVLAPTVISEAG